MGLNTFCCVQASRCSCCWRRSARGESAERTRSLQGCLTNVGFAPVANADTQGFTERVKPSEIPGHGPSYTSGVPVQKRHIEAQRARFLEGPPIAGLSSAIDPGRL